METVIRIIVQLSTVDKTAVIFHLLLQIQITTNKEYMIFHLFLIPFNNRINNKVILLPLLLQFFLLLDFYGPLMMINRLTINYQHQSELLLLSQKINSTIVFLHLKQQRQVIIYLVALKQIIRWL